MFLPADSDEECAFSSEDEEDLQVLMWLTPFTGGIAEPCSGWCTASLMEGKNLTDSGLEIFPVCQEPAIIEKG